MPPGWDYDSLGISSNLRMEEFRKSYSLRKENKVCIVVVLFLTISIVLYFLDYANSSNPQKIVRTKRHLQTIGFRKYQDIEILSESRKNYHPNHRYEEEEPESFEKMTDGLENRRSWSAGQPRRERHPNNVQDVILRGKLRGPRAEGQSRVVSDLLKGSGSTMRLKGVYLHPGSEDGLFGSQSAGTFYDSNEINNLMSNDSGTAGKQPAKRKFKSPGAPFRLPSKGAEGSRRQSPNQRSKTRPITIYLDFYPMNYANEFKRRKPESNIKSPSATKFHNPLLIHPANVGKFLPQGNPNGIIMKLNLYPKESTISEWKFDRQKPHSKYNKRADKKSFGWFSKHEKKKKTKKDHPKKCTLLGLNPRGKRITAKWKNGKGEWIHAEKVHLKYLKKEND